MRANPPPEAASVARTAAGAVFCALLAWAPLNFGSARAGGPALLAGGCALGTALWGLAWLLRGPRPDVPRWAWLGSGLVLLAALPWAAGWFPPTGTMPFTAIHFARVAARWPRGLVATDPATAMALAVALAAAFPALLDLARSRRWALAFAAVAVGTAAIVGSLALAQSFTRAPGLLWRADPGMPTNFAGTFFHHTAAGAYFNTAWPLAAALAVLAVRRGNPDTPPARALVRGAAVAAAIVLAAAHTSHVSRFPQVAALLVLPWLWSGLALGGGGHRRLLFGAVAGAVLLGAVAGRGGDILARWHGVIPAADALRPVPPHQWTTAMRDDLVVPGGPQPGLLGDRLESWRTAGRAIAARPFTGHGPGNWRGAASHHSADPFVRTFFLYLQFTHQEFLQRAVEWGLIGAAGYALILFGGPVAFARARAWTSPRHRALGLAAACGLAAVLLQAQLDFPLQIPAVALNATLLSALAAAAVRPFRP